MAFRTNDFKKTTRRAKGDAPAMLYPHQIRDKKSRARLEVAIRMFDGLVGRRRGEMDAGSLVDFFGDPRLARGVVACLGQYYRYRTPPFVEIVGEEANARLLEARLSSPIALRAHTYAHVNAHNDGFLTEASRPACYDELASNFGLIARDWAILMHLDGEDNQILTRPGGLPSAEDIAALYNFHALDTALRRAVKVVMQGLMLSSSDALDIRGYASRLGIKAMVSAGGDSVSLAPDDTAPRHHQRTGNLARALLMLAMGYAGSGTQGYVEVLLGTRRHRLLLGRDVLKALGASLAPESNSPHLCRRLEQGETLYRDLLKLRARGETAGWKIKRLPEPIVTAQGTFLPDLRLTRSDQAVAIALGHLPPEHWDGTHLSFPLSRRPLDARQLLARAEEATVSLFSLPEPPAVPADVRTLCDRAAAQGLVRTGEAQRALHLLEEEPLIEWVKRAADPRVRYIPGLGLCAQEMVSAITEAESAV